MATVTQTFLIPLTNVPQQFEIVIGTKDYIVTNKWNDSPEAGWVLDFDDAITGDNVVANVPLVTGIDILSGLEYLGFEGQLIVQTNGDQDAVPTLDNLGVESNLYFLTTVTQ